MSAKRPDRLSMEGMIWNANHVLEKAVDPAEKGIPKDLFQNCVGICLLSVVEVGFVFSGSVGSGILLKKQTDGSWSPPCAMGLAGMGWGALVGGALKDIMIFIFDHTTMDGMMGEAGLKIGAQLNLTVGPMGRNYEGGVGISTKGATGTFSVAFSKGIFAGASIEGAVIGPRGGVNDQFYDKVTSPQSILDAGTDVEIPDGKVTLIEEVYEKLAKLAAGETHTPTPEEVKKSATAADIAQQTSEAIAQQDPSGVVKVDAAAEAAKEAGN